MTDYIYEIWKVKHYDSKYSDDKPTRLGNVDDKEKAIKRAKTRFKNERDKRQRRKNDSKELELVEHRFDQKQQKAGSCGLPIRSTDQILYKSVISTISGSDTVEIKKPKRSYYVVKSELDV